MEESFHFSSSTVLDYLELVSHSLLRRKRRRELNSRNIKKQGMMIEEGRLKEVMVKVVIMEKMPEKKTG